MYDNNESNPAATSTVAAIGPPAVDPTDGRGNTGAGRRSSAIRSRTTCGIIRTADSPGQR